MVKKTSKVLFQIKNKTLFKSIYSYFFKKNKIINDEISQNEAAKYVFNYKYDCRKPRTFNEYLGWLKFNYSNDLWKKCADKLGAKQFLFDINYSKYVPKTLMIYRDSSEIDLSLLPDRFVLKTNHDSGSVCMCNKNNTDFKTVFSKLDASLRRRYNSNGEWVYSDIQPVIFAEEILEPTVGTDLIDYKFFVYNGKFQWGFTCQNRNTDCRFVIFEKNFEIQDVDYIYRRPNKKNFPIKPIHFDEMVEIAEKIGKYFLFVRIDFYETKKGLMIGELTFFSQSGLGPFTSYKFDLKYGKLFKNIISTLLLNSKDY